MSKKGLKTKIIAISLAGLIALGTGITWLVSCLKNKGKNEELPQNSSSSVTIDIDDLGTELDFPEEPKKEYGETTGKVDKDKVVEKNDKVYVDKENAEKADKVGTSSIDTKNDTLKVESDGKVKETEKGYEIKDKETGSVIQSGNVSSDGTIEGFEKNEQLGGTFEEKDDTDNLVRADSDYYNEEGKCIILKGSILSKESLEYAKKHLSTKPPVTSSNVTSSNASSNVTSSNTSSNVTSSNTSSNVTSSNTSSNVTSSDKGITNADGTYTIDGLTYLSKADYQQCIIDGYEGYAIIDGIVQPLPQNIKQSQK